MAFVFKKPITIGFDREQYDFMQTEIRGSSVTFAEYLRTLVQLDMLNKITYGKSCVTLINEVKGYSDARSKPFSTSPFTAETVAKQIKQRMEIQR